MNRSSGSAKRRDDSVLIIAACVAKAAFGLRCAHSTRSAARSPAPLALGSKCFRQLIGQCISDAVDHPCASLAVLTLFAVAGCATTQLNYNTLNLAKSLDGLNSQQVFYNLYRTNQDPYFVPSQAGIVAGTATTTNIVTPTLTAPLGAMTAVTSQLATTGSNMVASGISTAAANSVATAVSSGTSSSTTTGGAAGPGAMAGTTSGTTVTTTSGTTSTPTTTTTNGNMTAATNSTVTTHSNKSLSLAYTDNWSEGWTLDPAADPSELRRLRALYRYVLGKSHRAGAQFLCEYPLQQPTPSAANGPTTITKTSANSHSATVTTTTTNLSANDNTVRVRLTCATVDGSGDTYFLRVKQDLLQLPNCIVCEDSSVPSGHEVTVHVNHNLVFNSITAWSGSGQQPPGVSIGSYGTVQFFACAPSVAGANGYAACANGEWAFHEFLLFIMQAMAKTPAGAGTGGTTEVLTAPLVPGPLLE